MNTIDNEKSALRNLIRAKKRTLSLEVIKEYDEKIFEKFITLDEYKRCTRLFIYFSMQDEAGTHKIIEKAISDGKKVALPVCGENHTMKFYQVKGEDIFKKGAYGIPAPDIDTCPEVLPDARTLIAVPGVAFSPDGLRMGRGGGYYDRYLADVDCLTVGICYDEFIYDKIPADKYDIRTDRVVTPNNIFG